MRRNFRAPSAGRHMLVSAGVRNHCPRFQQAQTRVNWAVQGFGWLPFVGAFGAIVVHRASEGIPNRRRGAVAVFWSPAPYARAVRNELRCRCGVSFRVPSTLWCERVNGHRQRPASTAWHSRRARMANLNQLLLWVGATSRGPVRAAVDGSPPRTTGPPKVEADNAPTARICDEFEPCSKPSEVCLNPHRRTQYHNHVLPGRLASHASQERARRGLLEMLRADMST
jgi:hypothetical protein